MHNLNQKTLTNRFLETGLLQFRMPVRFKEVWGLNKPVPTRRLKSGYPMMLDVMLGVKQNDGAHAER